MARARKRGELRPKGPTITPMEEREGNAGAWRLCQGKAGGTLSPTPVSTKVVQIAQESKRKGLREDGQQQPCRLWSRKPQVLGPKGSLLTNRMTELVTYGSVGGGGRKPASYPAREVGRFEKLQIQIWSHSRPALINRGQGP